VLILTAQTCYRIFESYIDICSNHDTVRLFPSLFCGYGTEIRAS